MATRVKLQRIVLNRAGIHAMLNSEEVQQRVVQEAADVAARAGAGYAAAQPHKTGQRVAVNVYPATNEAYDDNMANNTLLKTIGGGRG